MVNFDISADELPIFLAEADENLQTLDESLLLLEKNNGNEEDIQTAFRAAHTLKGMAGMIGHERMVAITHALETVFDLVRKKSLNINAAVIDACLSTVDTLRLLREEVETSEASDVDIDAQVVLLEDLLHQGRAEDLEAHLSDKPQKSRRRKTVPAKPDKQKPAQKKKTVQGEGRLDPGHGRYLPQECGICGSCLPAYPCPAGDRKDHMPGTFHGSDRFGAAGPTFEGQGKNDEVRGRDQETALAGF